jgi:hypothetical protein
MSDIRTAGMVQKFKAGDRVLYKAQPWHSSRAVNDSGLITRVDFTRLNHTVMYFIEWDNTPEDNGWISDGNLTLIEHGSISVNTPKIGDVSVEKALELKNILEKDILALIEKYQSCTKLQVKNVNLEKYSCDKLIDNEFRSRKWYTVVSVDINL